MGISPPFPMTFLLMMDLIWESVTPNSSLRAFRQTMSFGVFRPKPSAVYLMFFSGKLRIQLKPRYKGKETPTHMYFFLSLSVLAASLVSSYSKTGL